MFNASPFFDYNISHKCLEKENYGKTIKLLYDFGYRTIAVNQTIHESELEPKKKKKKGETREPADPVPEPFKAQTVKGCEDLRVLSRLTISFSNQDVIHKVTKSPQYKKYDIVAALPTTSQAFLFTSSNFDIDIVTFNPENKTHLKLNRKLFNQLIERGVHFEIPYGPAIESATKRKYVIHTAHLYHTLAKSRNVIISSAATSPILIRSPYDIINLGLIFGLNEQQAKNAITHCGRKVFINSVGRRHGKSVMFVENMEEKKTDISVIEIPESDDDDVMEVVEPAPKKIKQ